MQQHGTPNMQYVMMPMQSAPPQQQPQTPSMMHTKSAHGAPTSMPSFPYAHPGMFSGGPVMAHHQGSGPPPGTTFMAPGMMPMPSMMHMPLAMQPQQQPAVQQQQQQVQLAVQASSAGLPPYQRPTASVVDGDEDGECTLTPACRHNNWDNVRVKKGVVTLACRICRVKWKTVSTIVKCPDFFHGLCLLGVDCPLLHVHRYKNRVKSPDPVNYTGAEEQNMIVSAAANAVLKALGGLEAGVTPSRIIPQLEQLGDTLHRRIAEYRAAPPRSRRGGRGDDDDGGSVAASNDDNDLFDHEGPSSDEDETDAPPAVVGNVPEGITLDAFLANFQQHTPQAPGGPTAAASSPSGPGDHGGGSKDTAMMMQMVSDIAAAAAASETEQRNTDR
eukprot:PhM_4_TR419/c5_g2_i2/m.23560